MLVFHGCRIAKDDVVKAGSCVADSHELATEIALSCVAQGAAAVYFVESDEVVLGEDGRGFLTADAPILSWHRVSLSAPATHWSSL